jgi:hypothetical protein
MSSNGGTPELYAELYKYDGTTFTLIATSSHEILYDGVNLNLYSFATAVPQTVLTVTDRLAIKLYADNSGGKTTTIHTQDSHLCQVITTFSTGLTALNGLTAQVQYFGTGTSGTDFNIVSSVATHTFNIPSASATNRGLITTGTQTIAGAKTFTSPTNYDNVIRLKQSLSTYATSSGYTTLFSFEGGGQYGFGFYNGGGTANFLDFSTAGSYRYTFPSATGTLALTSDIPSLTGYVPYTGATNNVDLGINYISSSMLFLNGTSSPMAGQITMKIGSSYSGYSGGNYTFFPSGNGQLYFISSLTGVSDSRLFILNSNGLTANTLRTYNLPNASGTIALTSDLTGGTVTSVGLSAPTGFSVTGSPVTTSGTLALSFASGYSLPTIIKQSNWDDAYTWVAAFPTQTGNSGKFLTTDGSTLSWAANPLGTVTSVAMTVPTGLSISGSPITTSGTLAVTLASGYVIPTQTTLDGKVPYTGATTNLDMGANGLYANNLTIRKISTSATIDFPNTGTMNDPGYIKHTESPDNTAVMSFSVGDNDATNDYFVFGNTSSGFVERFKITANGIVTIGTWQGNAIADSYISSAATWNAKQNAITLTTTGTSGAATFVSNTLNIPNYGSALSSYLPLTGGTLTGPLGGTSATFSVNQNSTITNSFINTNTTNNSSRTILNVTAGNATLQIQAIHSDNIYITPSTATDTYLGYNSILRLLANGNATFSGNVAIGSSSAPSYTLDVSGTGRFTTTLNVGTTAFVNTDIFIGDTTSGDGRLFITSPSNQGVTLRRAGAADRFKLFVGNGTTYTQDNCIILGTNTDIDFYTGSSPVRTMTISNNNRVGICTNIPNTLLEIGATTIGGAEYSAFTTNQGGGVSSKYSFWRTYGGGSTVFRAAYVANYNQDDANSSANDQRLVFATKSGTAEPTTKMTITGTGNVGIGDSTTAISVVRLRVKGSDTTSSNYAFNTVDSSGGDLMWTRNDGLTYIKGNVLIASTSDATNARVYIQNGSASYGIVYQNGSTNNFFLGTDGSGYLKASAWTYGSDRRMKENINYIQTGLDKVMALKPATFDYIDGVKNNIGWIAQDVQEVIPEAVSVTALDTNGYLNLKSDFIVPYLVKAIQEQQAQIEELKALINK